MFLGSHVSFGIDNQNICIRSVGDPKFTAIQNIVVTWLCRCVHGEERGESVRGNEGRCVCALCSACVCVCVCAGCVCVVHVCMLCVCSVCVCVSEGGGGL